MKPISILVAVWFCACSCVSVPKLPTLDSIVADSAPRHLVSVIYFRGDVDTPSAVSIVQAISSAQSDGTEVIVLEINTGGGEVDSAWKIIKAIEDSKIPVVCVADLQAASAGFYILETCHVRLMTPHTSLMLHQPARKGVVPGGGRAEDWMNVAQQLKAMHEAMVLHISKRLKVDAEFVKQKTSGSLEWWLNTDEALKVGAVDRIVESTTKVVNSYQKKGRL
jgi:membrane-bound serine protease (ClpP class)